MKKHLSLILASSMILQSLSMAQASEVVGEVEEAVTSVEESASIPMTELDENLVIVGNSEEDSALVDKEISSVPLVQQDSDFVDKENEGNITDAVITSESSFSSEEDSLQEGLAQEKVNIDIDEGTTFSEISDSDECGANGDNLTWALTDSGVLTITGSGDMANFSWGTSPWYAERASIQEIVLEAGITSIGNYAFQSCENLEEVSIPTGVTSIGICAFYSCQVLDAVSLPDTVESLGRQVFSYCTSLASLNIPIGVTELINSQFSECTGLTTLHIPESIISLASNVFSGCSNLESITVDSNNTAYVAQSGILYDIDVTQMLFCPNAMKGEVVVPDTVTSLGSAFSYCTYLTKITIPEGLTSIESYAFYHCTSLTEIILPETLISIADRAFGYCGSLRELTIPSAATLSVGPIFENCPNLAELHFDNDSGYIYGTILKDCSGLTTISVNPENTRYTTVDGVLYSLDMTTLVCYPNGKFDNAFTLPSTVTSLDSSAFYYTKNLMSIYIPSSVMQIPYGSFLGCDNLTTVFFGGSETEWDVLVANLDLDHSSIGQANIIFNASSPDNDVTITLNTNGGYLSFTTLSTSEGGTLNNLPIPTKKGHTCTGWFTEVDSGEKITTTTVFDSDTTIYAQWKEGTTTVVTDFSYTIEADWTITIDSYLGTDTEIVIPNEINGMLVTAIGPYALNFYNNFPITIEIPDSVTQISDYAFKGIYEFTVDENNSVFSSKDGVLFDKKQETLICYPSVKENLTYSVPAGVKSMKTNAFQYCTHLTEVTIPSSIETIELPISSLFEVSTLNLPIDDNSLATFSDVDTSPYAFYDTGASQFRYCEKLAKITVDEDNQYYSSADGILYNKEKNTLICYPSGRTEADFTVRDDVTAIGDSAFYSNGYITNVFLSETVIDVGAYAFFDCNNLEVISLSDSIRTIGTFAFGSTALKSISLPANLEVINAAVFTWCYDLEEVIFPDTLTEIGYMAFNHCENLSHIDLPSSLIAINDDAFFHCSSLTEISIPNSVTTIGGYAFGYCEGLIDVTFGNSVESIGSSAFYFTAVTEITLPESLEEVSSWLFYSCKNLEKITLPQTTKSIGDEAFKDCVSLIEITIPDAVTSVKYGTFSGCTSIESISIPEGVTEIEYSAFSNCSSLKEIIIPKSVDTIAGSVFNWCNALSDIYYTGTEDEWSLIALSTSGNTIVNSANIHYNYTVPEDSTTHTITLSPEGGTLSSTTLTTDTDGTLSSLPSPTRTGYTFDGWYTASTGGDSVDESYVFSGNTTIYAQWTAISTDAFTDVSESDWYYSSVQYVTENGYMTGTTSTTFSPNANTSQVDAIKALTLAFFPTQLATMETLYPTNSDWDNCLAVLQQNVSNDHSIFLLSDNGEASITREGLCAMMDVVLSSYGVARLTDAEVERVTSGYTDLSDTDYLSAIAQCIDFGLLSGTVDGSFMPSANISRGEVAMIVKTICESDALAGKNEPVVTYAVTFNSNGGNSVSTQSVIFGETATKPTDPTRTDYTFSGWYSNSSLTTMYDFSKPVTSATTVYAKWTESSTTTPSTSYTITLNTNGGTVSSSSLTTGGDGKLTSLPTPYRTNYSFQGWYTASSGGSKVTTSTVFDSDETIYAQWTYTGSSSGGSSSSGSSSGSSSSGGSTSDTTTDTEDESDTSTDTEDSPESEDSTGDTNEDSTETPKYFDVPQVNNMNPNTFSDLDTSAWFYEPVKFAYEHGLMSGTGDGEFSPDLQTSRAMIVQVLYNVAGQPVVSNGNFTDVASDAWYAKAVSWASSVGVVGGVGDNQFNPNGDMTREQLVVMLYGFEKLVSSDGYTGSTALSFTDTSSISSWAVEATAWAVSKGIVAGKPNGGFDPQATASRAEVAQILMNFVEMYS